LADTKARYEHALAEVTQMKRALAERARHVAELEDRLMRQVEEGARGSLSERRAPVAGPTESELARAVAAAEEEKALARAERERLAKRERDIREAERELAGFRTQLEEEWRRLAASAPAPDEGWPLPKSPAPTQQSQPAATSARKPATTRRRTTKPQ
jgi:DNA repair exonuclease SbcCD ATPase subunit